VLATYVTETIKPGDFVTVSDDGNDVLGFVIKERYAGWFLINFLDRKVNNQWEGVYKLRDLKKW
tara:strand:- start:311 stop:502 length:192 start_codon:yes stop_codon:yes gene_type:complete